MTGDLNYRQRHKLQEGRPACSCAMLYTCLLLAYLDFSAGKKRVTFVPQTGQVTLDHAGAFGRNFDLAVLDRPLGADLTQ